MLIHGLRRFACAQRGVAAIEFALILPVMLILFIGGVQVTDLVICKQKVANLSSTAAQLVAQDPAISNTGLTNVFNALNAVIYPYPVTGISVVVSDLKYGANNASTVYWSKAYPTGAGRASNSTVTVPNQTSAADSDLVMTEVKYNYAPILGDIGLGWFMPKTITLTSTFYARPRQGGAVELTN